MLDNSTESDGPTNNNLSLSSDKNFSRFVFSLPGVLDCDDNQTDVRPECENTQNYYLTTRIGCAADLTPAETHSLIYSLKHAASLYSKTSFGF